MTKFLNVPLGRRLKKGETVYPKEKEWLLPHGLALRVLNVVKGQEHEHKNKKFQPWYIYYENVDEYNKGKKSLNYSETIGLMK